MIKEWIFSKKDQDILINCKYAMSNAQWQEMVEELYTLNVTTLLLDRVRIHLPDNYNPDLMLFEDIVNTVLKIIRKYYEKHILSA